MKICKKKYVSVLKAEKIFAIKNVIVLFTTAALFFSVAASGLYAAAESALASHVVNITKICSKLKQKIEIVKKGKIK